MSHIVSINKEEFTVKINEYNQLHHQQFTNLHILDSLSQHEFIISLLHQLSLCSTIKPNLIISEMTHGGFIPIKLSSHFNVIEGIVATKDDFVNMEINRKKYDVHNITIFDKAVWEMIIREDNIPYIAFIKASANRLDLGENTPIFILTDDNDLTPNTSIYKQYTLRYNSQYRLFVHISKINEFESHFKMYFEDGLLAYDNLLHLTMIIKNGGDSLADVLRENMKFFDEYTILDTGSTDNTVQVIKDVLKNKKGRVFEEPFINFRDSRNRCLDLAGDSCKFTIMLDDTYIIKENLRGFLQTVRGDQFSDSFSLYIKSDDVEYGSNRIIKSDTHLRYIYKIHEVISPFNNNNVIVPMSHGYIFDFRSDYMEERTMTRKYYDLKILYEMIDDDPNDSRAFYYLGQTYNLIKEHQKAYENFLKRVDHPHVGFIQEKIDACFEAARLSNFYLNKPWSESEALYIKAYEMDKSRPDSLYFLGIHHYLEQNYSTAYDYFKIAYTVGYPAHCQYSLKPTLSFYYLPKFLSEVCYYMKDYKLGFDACQFFLQHNEKDKTDEKEHYTMTCWNKIYNEILKFLQVAKDQPIITTETTKPKIVFIVNGGFNTWTGSDILKRGIGGSETFIIEISKYVQQDYNFQCIVFCNCEGEEIYEGVEYKPLAGYTNYIATNEIHTVVVSRYPEYLPAIYQSEHIGSVYLILHDLIPSGEIIIRDPRLRKVLLLSDYHKQFFDNMFPTMADISEKFEYGIDQETVLKGGEEKKIPYKFIYSSFANRGLLYLLQMWRKIKDRFPSATLHIHCDVDNKWLNNVNSSEMQLIKNLLFDLKNDGVFYKGWTSKSDLYSTWKTSDVWFYPTTFLETFCLTALECALSKTLAVTFPIGSLLETVGNRGVMINQNVTLEEGQEKTLQELFWILDESNRKVKDDYIERNYQWAMTKSWKLRGRDFANLLPNDNPITSHDEGCLNRIIQYYTSFMNKKIGNVLLFGKCDSIDDSIFKNSIIHKETRETSIVTYIKKKIMFNFIYLDDVKNAMSISLCYDMLLEPLGILRVDIKSFELLTSQFNTFVILERNSNEVYLEKSRE